MKLSTGIGCLSACKPSSTMEYIKFLTGLAVSWLHFNKEDIEQYNSCPIIEQ